MTEPEKAEVKEELEPEKGEEKEAEKKAAALKQEREERKDKAQAHWSRKVDEVRGYLKDQIAAEEEAKQQKKQQADEIARRARKGTPTGEEQEGKMVQLIEAASFTKAKVEVLTGQASEAAARSEEARLEVVAASAAALAQKADERSGKRQKLLSSYFKSPDKKEGELFTDPSAFLDARGKGRKKPLTLEEARRASEKMQTDKDLMDAWQRQQEAEKVAAEAKRAQKVAEREAGRVQKALVQVGKQETRGRKGKQETLVCEPEAGKSKAKLLSEIAKISDTGRKRKDLLPRKRQKLTELIDLEVSKDEHRLGKTFWQRMVKETGYTEFILKGLITPKGRETTEKRMAARKRGKKRYWKRILDYHSQGMRETQGILKGGPLKPVKEQLKNWCDVEVGLGHDLSGDDLLDQYQLEVEELSFNLAKEEDQWAPSLLRLPEAEIDDPELQALITEISSKREMLKTARSFLETGLGTKQAKAYHKQQLLCFCDVVERKPDLVFPMSEAGE